MKKILKAFTPYFMLLSLIIIYMHYIGQDSIGLVLFHFNIIMRGLLYSEFAENVIQAGPKIKCGNLAGEIHVYWYIAHFISFIIYGLVFDFLRFLIRKFGSK